MNPVISRTLEFLALPPGNLLIFLAVALLLYQWRSAMLVVLWVGIVQTVILSLPVVAEKLMSSLEQQYPAKADLWLQQPLPEAIVVLGAGRNLEAVEYAGKMSASTELERLNYAAYLHRKTGLPILISGSSNEAEYMRDVMENTFQVPIRWQEGNSHTTWENAAFSDQILREAGIRSAWVVTQAWHMPRAMLAFQDRSIRYAPASTTYGSSNFWQHEWLWWTPQANALSRSHTALHEWLGLLTYRFK